MGAAAGPLRSCVGCRQVAPAAELQRYVLIAGKLTPDPQRRMPGRGAWLHAAERCHELARSRRGFARSFRRQVDDGVLG